MAAQGQWFQRCDGWCDSVSPPPRCVRPCNEIQDIRFPEHPGPHMCRECARGEENATPASDQEHEVEIQPLNAASEGNATPRRDSEEESDDPECPPLVHSSGSSAGGEGGC